jgi:arsenite/tail-anchored protein-transporting ATPase
VSKLRRIREFNNIAEKERALLTPPPRIILRAEFLSLYETERLVQELARFEIDSRNIVINQVIFPEEVGTSQLLAARVRMQQKYLDQFYDLYEDFHIVKMPLLEEEVRGSEALESFSQFLITPYVPAEETRERLEKEANAVKARLQEIETKLKQLS